MHKLIHDQEVEDQMNAQKRHDAALRYQHELDAQVNETRQRSIDNLVKTMTDRELKYNADLIRRTKLDM